MFRDAGWMVVAAVMLGGGAAARGQWEVIFLHPEGFYSSSASAAGAGQQGGLAFTASGLSRPILWNSSGEDYVNLLPSWARQGMVYGMDENYQVGVVSTLSSTVPAMWSGTAESFVDLTPGGNYPLGYAQAVKGDEQVGFVGYTPTNHYHAALWRGSAATFVDLHPSIALWSQAFCTDGAQQGGWVDVDQPGVGLHAALWQGSAASFIDMNPVGARESIIYGAAGSAQVGRAQFGTQHHAVVWHGSPANYVDLNPTGGRNSHAYATTGTLHAGYTSHTGWAEAGIWTGDDPESFENVHVHLGSGWLASSAYGISVCDERIYIAGSAARYDEPGEAVLWIKKAPSTELARKNPRRLPPHP